MRSTRINKENGGYIGLIVLIITFAIIVWLCATQLRSLVGTSSAVETQTTISAPIERAKDAKALLERQDRSNLNY